MQDIPTELPSLPHKTRKLTCNLVNSPKNRHRSLLTKPNDETPQTLFIQTAP
jgi:hypothetical protein